jgi:hypothetical protein
LTGTAVIDLIGGQTLGADEVQHLVAVAGALLLIWQARTNRRRSADGTADTFRTGAGARPVTPATATPGRDASAPADGLPGSPGGGAAVVAVPDAAARTDDRVALSDGRGGSGTTTGEGSGAAVA